VREVVETYGLDGGLIDRSRRLKRATFPLAVAGMLAVVGIVALGGAADPATGRKESRDWVTPHLVGALGLMGVIAWCFQAQVPNIRRQHELIDDVMLAVRQERQRRGLDVPGELVTVGDQ
jgi:hypothetical protein